MNALSDTDLQDARQIARRLGRGAGLSQDELDALTAAWLDRVQPPAQHQSEQFAVTLPDGSTTGVHGPRWLFHLFGIRHRAVEIALSTQSGLIVLQQRSPTKAEWPGAFDMAVAGHVSQNSDGSDMTFAQAAWKEIAEEIGLDERDSAEVLVEGGFITVGPPYCCFEGRWQDNPPFLDAEVRQIFAATLTGAGLSRISFPDNEVSGIFLATVDTAWEILRTGDIASGLRYSLPRYLDWVERGRTN
jgi:isopentenyldiphosphate isomerase